MSSINGARFIDGWKCSDGYLPCFRDCCARGKQFCNAKQKRCQSCQIREKQCGNFTQPWECDLYCFQRGLDLETGGTALVSPVYKYSTIGLGIGTGCLIALLLGLFFKKRRNNQPAQTASSTDSEIVSLVESSESESSRSKDNKEVQTEDPSDPVREEHNPRTAHPTHGAWPHAAEGHSARAGTAARGEPADAPTSSLSPCHPHDCRDPRLYNIIPSADADTEVATILTNVTIFPSNG